MFILLVVVDTVWPVFLIESLKQLRDFEDGDGLYFLVITNMHHVRVSIARKGV